MNICKKECEVAVYNEHPIWGDTRTKTVSNSFTSTGNNSHIPVSSLFHQREMLRDGTFFVYLCDTKVSG